MAWYGKAMICSSLSNFLLIGASWRYIGNWIDFWTLGPHIHTSLLIRGKFVMGHGTSDVLFRDKLYVYRCIMSPCGAQIHSTLTCCIVTPPSNAEKSWTREYNLNLPLSNVVKAVSKFKQFWRQYIGWQWRNFFISYLCQLFFRHVVGQALRSVSYSDITFLVR